MFLKEDCWFRPPIAWVYGERMKNFEAAQKNQRNFFLHLKFVSSSDKVKFFFSFLTSLLPRKKQKTKQTL